jgi:hypothetical protein
MPSEIYLRLYEELSDYVPIGRRKQRFMYHMDSPATVKDLLEALRVPSTCVEFILVNGGSADLSHPLKDGDFVSIFPVFESLDVKSLVRLRKEPLRQIRFMAGKKLARLGFYLRLLGFDTLDCASWPQERVVRAAEEERRILLMPEFEPIKIPDLPRVCRVRETRPLLQLKEIISRLDLQNAPHFSWFQSMIVCVLSRGIQTK